MRRIAIYLCVLVLAAATGLACGSDSNGGGGGGTASLDNLSSRVAGMYCGRIFGCCDSEERAEMFGDEFSPSNESECSSQMTVLFDEQMQELQEAVDAGRLIFHEDKAAECLNHLESVDCSAGVFPEGEDEIPACDETTEGLVEPGDACAMNDECKSGRCAGVQYDEDGNRTQMGACGGGGAGQTCEWSDECGEGHYCDRQYNSETEEFEGTCATIGQLNEECSGQQSCAEGLYCNETYDSSTGEMSGTCEAKGEVGDDCSSGSCVDGTFCEIDSGQSRGTCAPLKSVGESCERSQCAEGSYCEANDDQTEMTCQATKGAGEPCSSSYECDGWCGSQGGGPDADFTCQSDSLGSTMCSGN